MGLSVPRIAARNALLSLSAGVCILGSLASMARYCWPSSPRGDIQIRPSPVQDIGLVRQGTETAAVFELVNKSAFAISVLDVGTSCGCVRSSVSKWAIGPAESTLVTLRYNSGEARGQVDARAVVVYRREGDETTRSLRLNAVGKIDADYAVEPERLEFGPETMTTRVTLTPCHIDQIRITKALCDKRFFTARLISTDADLKQVVEVAYDPAEYYPDAGPAHVVIRTDAARQPVLNVPIDVRGPRSRRR